MASSVRTVSGPTIVTVTVPVPFGAGSRLMARAQQLAVVRLRGHDFHLGARWLSATHCSSKPVRETSKAPASRSERSSASVGKSADAQLREAVVCDHVGPLCGLVVVVLVIDRELGPSAGPLPPGPSRPCPRTT